ncbi:hypothetical protein F4553_004624 [Allocatelliglobosispora scoriae]|uniref:Uncharacterized protein n=1 Tax=Allocatelliglobosispora scoriae TaxID=643052 RepID=A0A841BU77_9ACTN|nr:hypothetical protein [Allocatelliglobosispora scoriae]MBB5871245.1 hypothetical protein [Allocatelliglobosispora scoriae]
MIYDLLLRTAVRRWPAELQEDLLREWTAELHASGGAWQRLRFAGSLAVSRPHRPGAGLPRPVLSIGGAAFASIAVVVLPLVYGVYSALWTPQQSSDTIGRQALAGVASFAVAALFGAVCARISTGMTRIVKPGWLPIWVFGLLGATLIIARAGHPYAALRPADLRDIASWLSLSVLIGVAVVRLTSRRLRWVAWLLMPMGAVIAP